MTEWDRLRAKQRGQHGAPAPTCSRCGRRRVYNPCRDCATPAELARTFPHPKTGEPIPYYPRIS